MCGKASVSHLSWTEVYAYARLLTAPATLPADPAQRVNVSPSRLRRKSEPGSMVWETLPVIYPDEAIDRPGEALWPFLPAYSEGRLPMNRDGRLISTANARLRHEGAPFAPTFMGAWSKGLRVLVLVSWFYEFDSRVKPQVPYAVFPLDAPFWMMAGLARWTRMENGEKKLTVAVITVEPNDVLRSVGHHRSPALLRSPLEARDWLRADRQQARQLLRPHPDETMGVEAVPMGIKIPGNQDIELPETLCSRSSSER
ncbi:MAG: SOS response-associated peptidase family protein [Lysobacterales bacterium]|jgi:putative SOS response-associated peptidase YedK